MALHKILTYRVGTCSKNEITELKVLRQIFGLLASLKIPIIPLIEQYAA